MQPATDDAANKQRRLQVQQLIWTEPGSTLVLAVSAQDRRIGHRGKLLLMIFLLPDGHHQISGGVAKCHHQGVLRARVSTELLAFQSVQLTYRATFRMSLDTMRKKEGYTSGNKRHSS